MKGDSFMFPNPQDALPLPSRPSLEYYRKFAKELVKAGKSGSLQPDDPIREFALRKFSETCTLTAAQFVIARSYGFESWPNFVRHLEALAKNSPVSRFEAAAGAIVDGDVTKLKQLRREDPKLIRAKSTREHGATLLHYVSANGVEGYRQKTPKNIVEITEVLLDFGAEIDATADVYGGGCTALGLAATSVHPERAGVQRALLQVLLDRGANAELESAGNRHSLVVACLGNGRKDAAEFLAPRIARLDLAAAAGVGRLDLVRDLFEDASVDQRNEAFIYACAYGRNDVVEFLVEQKVDMAARNRQGQTGLHMAAVGGSLDTVKLLLRHKAPLEAVNIYGGTVWGQTLWSAAHGGDADTYIAILEALVGAGAEVPERHTPVNARVDRWLAEHGSRAEPSWRWD
jgi:hypothetical protein